jgi:hypothetical protein
MTYIYVYVVSEPLDLGEETSQSQELWHLDPLRLALWDTQHVQGVS